MPVAPPAFDFDLDRLLSPIAPGNSAGASLRYDPAYDHIQILRKEDDATLPQGVWKADPKRADWASVESACLDILETRSKDLQVAAWLLEAWLHLHGYAGAAQGFRVMHALADAFWDDLHPQMQGGDVEFRVAPVLWLNDKLPPQLKLLPLTAPESQDVAVCSIALWEKASQRVNLRPGTSPKESVVSLSQLEQGAMLTPTERLLAKAAEVKDMLVSCAALDQLLDEKLGKEAPGLMPVRGVGEEALGILHTLLRDRAVIEVNDEPTVEEHMPAYSVGYFPEPEMMYQHEPGRIRSRAEAYQMLADAAEYLARTEPHSPTPYLVRRAINWGAMPLDQVLSELVRNQAELAEIYRLLDLQPPSIKK